jgi:hypothetical protein
LHTRVRNGSDSAGVFAARGNLKPPAHERASPRHSHSRVRTFTLDGLAAARARVSTGGQKPKLTLRQAHIARQMYEESDADGRRLQIAAEFGVTRPTIYRISARCPSPLTASERPLTPNERSSTDIQARDLSDAVIFGGKWRGILSDI